MNKPGYGGLPFYFDTSAGGIRDARTGQLLCTSQCFVVAKLNVGGRAVVLAWGLGGEDTRAAAAYLFYRPALLTARGNVAQVVRWSYIYETTTTTSAVYRVGIDFSPISTWP